MASEYSVSEAQLTGLFLQTLFYGVFLVTFGSAMRALLFGAGHQLKSLRNVNWLIFTAAILLFIFASMDPLLQYVHCVQAFIHDAPESTGLPDKSFARVPDWINVVKDVDLLMITCVGDAVLIYRCWVIYAKKWPVVVVPILLWLGNFVLDVMTIYRVASAQSTSLVKQAPLKPLLIAWWVIAMTFSLLTTGLIVFRIRRIDLSNRRAGMVDSGTGGPRQGGTRLQHVTVVIIESGLLYTATALITFCLVLVDSNALFPVSDAYVEIVGIAYNLILTRSIAGNSKPQTVGTTGSASAYRLRQLDSTVPVHSDVIYVTREVEQSHDNDNLYDAKQKEFRN